MKCDCGRALEDFVMTHDTGEVSIETLCKACNFNIPRAKIPMTAARINFGGKSIPYQSLDISMGENMPPRMRVEIEGHFPELADSFRTVNVSWDEIDYGPFHIVSYRQDIEHGAAGIMKRTLLELISAK